MGRSYEKRVQTRLPHGRMLCAGLLVLVWVNTRAQQTVFRNYSTEDGLPSSEVYDVRQDTKGFIWMTTDRGVCRYDGNAFQIFTTDDGLCSNTNFGMHEDKSGRLWFFSYIRGICYYHDGKFHTPAFNVALKKVLGADVIVALHVDEQGNIWLSRENKSCLVINRHGEIRQEMAAVEKNSDYLILKEFDQNQFLFWQSIYQSKKEAGDLYYENTSRGVKTRKILPASVKSLGNAINRGIAAEVFGRKTRFMLFHHGVVSVTDSGVTVFRFPRDTDLSGGINVDRKGDLWIGTLNKGVFRFPASNLELSPQNLLSEYSVSSISEDHESGMWFSTLSNGVFYLSRIQVVRIETAVGRTNVIVSDDSLGVFVGTRDMRLMHYTYTQGNIGASSLLHGEKHEITGLGLDSDYRLWVARTKMPLSVYYFASRRLFEKYSVGNVYVDSRTKYGVSFAGRQGIGKVSKTGFDSGSIKGLPFRGKILASCMLNSNTLLLGTFEGLWSFDLLNQRAKYLGEDNPALTSRINDICIDSRGRILIATIERGIIILDNDTAVILGTVRGLISNQCNKIQVDDDDNIWVATNLGLSYISRHKGRDAFQILNFTTDDGLVSNEIMGVTLYNDQVWLATGHGVCFFNTTTQLLNSVPPLVNITKLKVKELEYSLDNSLIFSYFQNDISIEYKGLSFRSPGGIIYKYRIDELDTAFHFTSEQAIRLANLAPGRYTFRLFAANSHGVWSTTPEILVLTILPPFWAKWWFILFVFLLLFGGVFTVTGLRIRQLKRRAKLREELHKYKLEALCAQMNPHFIFNSLSSVQNYLLKNDSASSSQYLARFSSLMRLTMENSIQTLVPLTRDLDALKLYVQLEQMRLKNMFSFELTIDPQIHADEIKVAPMVIQPMVENAIWHGLVPKGGEGKITVSLFLVDDYLACVIEDDGAGFKNFEKKGSAGIKLTIGRLQAIYNYYGRKDETAFRTEGLVNNSGENCGTRVTFNIPVLPSDNISG